LERQGLFAPPSLDALEQVFEYGLALRAGRVLVDLWDIGRISAEAPARAERIERLGRMNLSQQLPPAGSGRGSRPTENQSSASL
jgi:hypothetical protein